MTKLATTAVMCAALIGVSSASFAGGLTSPIVEPVPVAPVVDEGLSWTTAAIAAGVIGLALIALADNGDDDDDSSSTTTEAATE